MTVLVLNGHSGSQKMMLTRRRWHSSLGRSLSRPVLTHSRRSPRQLLATTRDPEGGKSLESVCMDTISSADNSRAALQRKVVGPVPRKATVVSKPELHKPIGLVLFSAYILAVTSELSGLPAPAWMPAMTGAAIGCLFAALNRFCMVRLWRSPEESLRVLITGGSKGLGKALAREFLAHGDHVVISGRSQCGLEQAIADLRSEVGHDITVTGIECDVSEPESVEQLVAGARSALGHIDILINNAGYSGSFQPFTQASGQQISQVVRTNLQGSLLCTRAVLPALQQQALGGHVFFMDGAGADGFATPQYAAYGATKAALPQLLASLQAELAGWRVGVHIVSPGMMLTELLLDNASLANKQVFNILCEQPETVAAFLVPRMRSVVARGQSGTYTRFLTLTNALARFITAPARADRFFDRQGNALYPSEHERILGRFARSTRRRAEAVRRRSRGLGVAYSLSLALSVLLLVMDASLTKSS